MFRCRLLLDASLPICQVECLPQIWRKILRKKKLVFRELPPERVTLKEFGWALGLHKLPENLLASQRPVQTPAVSPLVPH